MSDYNINYNLYLPSYSIGPDCYKEIPHVTRFFGKTAAVIGGKTAMAKAKKAMIDGVAGSDVKLLDFIEYGGDSTYENGDALIANPTVRDADMIFAVGGGRACDTGKYVADKLDKPLFTFPTVASNCASVTAISVIYNPDGSFREYYYPKLANHCFINSAVIADSPEPAAVGGHRRRAEQGIRSCVLLKGRHALAHAAHGQADKQDMHRPADRIRRRGSGIHKRKESVVRARPGDARHYYIDRHRLEHDEHG